MNLILKRTRWIQEKSTLLMGFASDFHHLVGPCSVVSSSVVFAAAAAAAVISTVTSPDPGNCSSGTLVFSSLARPLSLFTGLIELVGEIEIIFCPLC